MKTVEKVLEFVNWCFWLMVHIMGMVVLFPLSLLSAIIYLIKYEKPRCGWAEHFLMFRISP